MRKWFCFFALLMLGGCNDREMVDTFDNDDSYQFYISKSGIYEDDANSNFLLLFDKGLVMDNRVDYLVLLEDRDIGIDYKDKYILRDKLVLDGVEIYIDNMIGISFDNYLFCVYGDEWYYKDDFGKCDFIYILNGEDDVDISFSDRVKVLFYNEYSEFKTSFLEKMFASWLDTYIVSSDSVISLVISDDGYEVNTLEIEKE